MFRKKKHKNPNRLPWGLLVFLFLLIILPVFFMLSIYVNPPDIPAGEYNIKLQKLNDSTVTCDKSWLKLNKEGLWELFVEGDPYEIGLKTGALTQSLNVYQEYAFIDQISKMIPSKSYLGLLRYMIAFANRDLDKNIPKENLLEMYGISKYMSKEYDFIGPPYLRVLNYHAAHDIGHALISYRMVGCTSFAVKNSSSADSSLLIARNFDFYVGDKFAENKIVTFVKPDSGYRFMYVSWAGMTGVVSGMNEKGLTVTINAASSDIPLSVATPISIVTRNILQYAGNKTEAIRIASGFKTFVSESILVGSAEDNDAILIEKSPVKQFIFSSESDVLICTNHFQSDSFMRDKKNLENMLNSSSLYRHFRMKELIRRNIPVSYESASAIMRDKGGLRDANIGLGNEKSVNQLIAHHAIIFKPKQRMVWVSTSPYQLGKFVAYDLNKIFNDTFNISKSPVISEESFSIKTDPFYYSKEFKQYKVFKMGKEYISEMTKYPSLKGVSEKLIQGFVQSNPEYYYTYQVVGNYYKSRADQGKALKYYNIALTKEISARNEKADIENAIKDYETK